MEHPFEEPSHLKSKAQREVEWAKCDDPSIWMINVRATHIVCPRLSQPNMHVMQYGKSKDGAPLLKLGLGRDMMHGRDESPLLRLKKKRSYEA